MDFISLEWPKVVCCVRFNDKLGHDRFIVGDVKTLESPAPVVFKSDLPSHTFAVLCSNGLRRIECTVEQCAVPDK